MSRKPRTPVNLPQIATRLAGVRSLWEPLIAYDPVSHYYARLAAEPHFEAWLLTWVPGQGTDWHDHGGSAGAFVTLRGTLTEQHARAHQGPTAKIEPQARELGTSAVRSFGTRHLHKVTNYSLEPAVSLHVYSPAPVEMNRYQPRGEELALVQTQLVRVDW